MEPPADLTWRVHEDVTLYPIQRDDMAYGFRLGAFDTQGRPIEDLLHRHHGKRIEALPFEATVPLREAGTFVYGGLLWEHFGHFLTEGISRIWRAIESPGVPIVWHRFMAKEEPLPWQQGVLDVLGLGRRRHIAVIRPMRFERLIVPQQGFVMPDDLHPHHAEAIAVMPWGNAEPRTRVWISRGVLSGAQLSTVHGEAAVEARLAAAGWKVFSPERARVDDQLATYAGAEVIAGFQGSAFHTLLLGRNVESRVLIVRRGNRHLRTYEAIGRAKGLKQEILEVPICRQRGLEIAIPPRGPGCSD
jgi:capsular polysaccharide biosynthesis protein